MSHTPGPWMVEPHSDDFDGPVNVVSEYSTLEGRKQANWIAECDLQDDRIKENHANARLIAAAPDMYALLEMNADTFRDFSRVLLIIGKDIMSAAAGVAERAIREQIAAIAKAQGLD